MPAPWRTPGSALLLASLASVVISGCVGGGPTPQSGQESQQRVPGRTKTLNVGVASGVEAFSIVASASPTGGWLPLLELHTEGLATSDVGSRKKVGRLAEQVPTVENGGITVLPDSRMRVVFNLRKGVTWHDGTPFTAQDLVFSFQIGGPSGLPTTLNDALEHMSSVEAPDDATFVIYYKQPYYLATALGPSMFWPLPRHILTEPFQQYRATNNADALLQHPYWTSAYVHTGPFRLKQFDPGHQVSFEAYDGYFLGRPKIDTIHVKFFSDENTLVASLMAGATDLVPELALRSSTGDPLRDTWRSSGEGTVHVLAGPLRRLNPQFRAAWQMEPTTLDPRVRTALFQALDREELADTVGGGNRHLTAWEIVPVGDDNYEAVKDGLRPFPYNPDRAKAILREVGWTPGPDGKLRHASDGRTFRTSIWGNPDAGQELAAYASYWRAIGIEVEEFPIGGALRRDNEARAQYPGWESTASDIIGQMRNTAASAETRWRGNRNGYEDARAMALVAAFESSITDSDQARTTRAISDFVISEMLSVFTFANPTYVAARKNVKAYGDLAGGKNFEFYGGYYRNAYLWDLD